MPGKINCIAVRNCVKTIWDYKGNGNYSFYADNLNKDDTYIAIFSRHQTNAFDALKNSDEVNILWISDKAVNPIHRDNGPSNTVVIFELKE